MKISQQNKILELLDDGNWHCTSEMAALWMVDYRRRLVDLKQKGYCFENRRCTKHNHPMKEWRLMAEKPVSGQILTNQKPFNPKVEEFLNKWTKSKVENKQLTFL